MVNSVAAKEALNPTKQKEYREEDTFIPQKVKKDNTSRQAQKMLLTRITEEPFLLEKLEKYITPEDFEEGMFRTVATHLFEQIGKDALMPTNIINLFEEEEEQQEVASIFHAPIGELESREAKEKGLREVVIRVKKDSFRRKKEQMAETDPNMITLVMEEKKLQKELETISYYI